MHTPALGLGHQSLMGCQPLKGGPCQKPALTWVTHTWVGVACSLLLVCISPQVYEPPPPPAYRPGSGSLKLNGGGVPPPLLPASPYGGPTPASYATASTPAGPAFPVQVKVAQPVRGCGPPRGGPSQASGPLLGPHFPLPGRGEVWGAGYRSHREPGLGSKEEVAGSSSPLGGGRGSGYGHQVSPGQWDLESSDNCMLIGSGQGGVLSPGCQGPGVSELHTSLPPPLGWGWGRSGNVGGRGLESHTSFSSHALGP